MNVTVPNTGRPFSAYIFMELNAICTCSPKTAKAACWIEGFGWKNKTVS